MKKFEIGCKIFMAISVIFAAIGILMIFFNNTPFFSIANSMVDPLFWKNETPSIATLNFKMLFWTFTGMFHIIWGSYLFFVVQYGLMKKESWAWIAIFSSVIIWLFVDLYFSVSMGLYAISFNPGTIFFMILFVLPLILTKDVFNEKKKDNE
jgi:hypothetical protein